MRPRRVVVLFEREIEMTMCYDDYEIEPAPLQFVPRDQEIPPAMFTGIAKRKLKAGQLVTTDDVDVVGTLVVTPPRRLARAALIVTAVLTVGVPWWFGVLYLLGFV